MPEDLRIIQIGFGVVGRGVSRILATRQEELRKRYGFGIKTVALADSTSSTVDEGGLNLRGLLSRKTRTGAVGPRSGSKSVMDLIENVQADAVLELTPGNPSNAQPGASHFEASLEAGKHLVTANKSPLALNYKRLLNLARAHGLQLKYSACVGGGVPVLEFGEACLTAEPVTKIEGVLNATSNFILTEMERQESSFQEALKEAQRRGYAETNPALDIDGIDAACKIVIISNHILGTSYTLKDVSPINGIRGLTTSRIREAKRDGQRIRMVAVAAERPAVVLRRVRRDDELAVEGPCHSVKFQCKYSGPRSVSGMGAGGLTTSIAVFRDLVGLGRTLRSPLN